MNDEEEDRIRAAADKVLDDKLSASSTLSTQVRTVSLGVIGLVWLILSGMQPALLSTFSRFTLPLLFLAGAAVLVLLLDMAQALANYVGSDHAVRKAEVADSASEIHHDQSSLAYRSASWFFWGKIGLASLTTLILLVLIAYALIRYPPTTGALTPTQTPATLIFQTIVQPPQQDANRGGATFDAPEQIPSAANVAPPAQIAVPGSEQKRVE